MEIAFRPAAEQDFEACRRLYFSAMESTFRELNIDPVAHSEGFREQWVPAQVRIIQFDGRDLGWVQVIDRWNELFLAQIFVEPEFQRRGIGSSAIRCVTRQAAAKHVPVTLAVIKNNPARRLYMRLGFRTTHEDVFKLYMRLDPKHDADAAE